MTNQELYSVLGLVIVLHVLIVKGQQLQETIGYGTETLNCIGKGYSGLGAETISAPEGNYIEGVFAKRGDINGPAGKEKYVRQMDNTEEKRQECHDVSWIAWRQQKDGDDNLIAFDFQIGSGKERRCNAVYMIKVCFKEITKTETPPENNGDENDDVKSDK